MRLHHVLLLAIIISALSCCQSFADDAWQLTPTARFHWFDSALKLDSAPQAGISAAYSFIGNDVGDSLELEGEFAYVSTRSKEGAKERADVYLARVSALYPFFPRKRIVPYVAVGGGGMFVSEPGGNEAHPLVSYGITLRYYLAEWLALGTDLRQTLVYRDGFKSDFEAGVGVTFVLGGEQKFKRIPVPKAKVPPRPGQGIKRLDELKGDDTRKPEGPENR